MMKAMLKAAQKLYYNKSRNSVEYRKTFIDQLAREKSEVSDQPAENGKNYINIANSNNSKQNAYKM